MAGFFLALIILFSIQATAQDTTPPPGFRCTNPTTTTCNSLIDYNLTSTATLSDIAYVFQIDNLLSLLGANNLSAATSTPLIFNAGQILKIPVPCLCQNGTGISDHRPMYTVFPNDNLFRIASERFSGMVLYQQILSVNNITNVNTILKGQKLWIPLPCSCDDVGGEPVIHYGYLVPAGSSVGGIAQQFNTTERTLLDLNGMSNSSKLVTDSIIDIPLKVCKTKVRNNSVDPPLRVPNGTYTITANGCARCQCNAANNWILNCEPLRINLLNGQTCPSTQCLSQESTCKDGDGGRKIQWVIIALALGGGGLTIVIIIVLCLRGKLRWSKKPKYNGNVETFLKNHEFLAPKRYSYSQVKKMTNSFKTKLGQGGFGSVYKGVLSNKNVVAVKVLSGLKGNGEDFMNEVASVGQTSHVNIVCLVGFCSEGHRRALIYEFMPNGSLERFIYGQSTLSNSQLGWEKLHQIAIGIARGLEYLHKGCNTRILHLDIKPHNILLDQNMCPKISDFGLSKLFPDRTSIISMSHMRGTPGYIAPELFSRNFGQVSHKSDVYSYGMMVLEMVGGRKNIEVKVDHTSEIYFPHWIYKKLDLDEQLGLHGVVSDEENEVARKMIIVGLWCIQTNPLNRPTITKVLEMLEGDLQSLEIPPKPYLSSPSRAASSPPTDSSHDSHC